MIRFTVITITYNAQQVLDRTLQSVLHQTYEDVEHLIIDGASKDNTLAIAEAYKQQSDDSGCGHKVIIKSEPDHGIYDAMNKGLSQAMGDYVVFMNAGDFFPSADTLEQIARRCKLNEQPSEELPGLLSRLDAAMVREIVERLTPPFRETVVLRYFEDKTLQEMSELMSVPVGTVKWRLHQARNNLERMLSSLFKGKEG
jgi:RNA polymerase sigma factor (sigma-70 family)